MNGISIKKFMTDLGIEVVASIAFAAAVARTSMLHAWVAHGSW